MALDWDKREEEYNEEHEESDHDNCVKSYVNNCDSDDNDDSFLFDDMDDKYKNKKEIQKINETNNEKEF